MKREFGIWLCGAIWLTGILAACGVWARYDATPGKAGEPNSAFVNEGTTGWRLTVFLHPKCPCSRETIRQAAALATECPELTVNAVFVRPSGTAPGWELGENWTEAERLGLAVVCDPNGCAARSAGAETSGAAVLADPTGRVVFRGGLTGGRGRSGESVGRHAVLEWIRGKKAAESSPVFGCPLHTADE